LSRGLLLRKMLAPTQVACFGQVGRGIPSNVMNVDTKNKYQESRMLFFADPKKPAQKAFASRPKTISEIKKLQSFVK